MATKGVNPFAKFSKEDTKTDKAQDKGMMQKAVNKHEGRLHKGATMTKLAKGGGIETKGKTKGKQITMKGKK